MLYVPQSLIEHVFILSDYPFNAERGSYDISLVILSYIIAAFGAFVSLSLLDELWLATRKKQKNYIHISSALCLGAGIWAMHFVGMLSYEMDMVHKYDLGITFISMLIAAIVAYGFIFIVLRLKNSILTYIIGSITLGVAICSMHYTGMAAMIMDADILYLPEQFIASILISIIASAAAIGIIFRLKEYEGKNKQKWRILAALIIGSAICGMHYMGMFATVFLPYAECRFEPNQTYYAFAGLVAIVSGAIFISSIAINIAQKSRRENEHYSKSWNMIPVTIIILGFLLSTFSTFALSNFSNIKNEERLEILISDSRNVLINKYATYVNALRSGAGFMGASEFVSRAEWKNFIARQKIDESLPGINGVGFIEYVKAPDLQNFIEQVQKDDAESFTNHPDTPFEEKFIIKYVEPVSKNEAAIGLDIGFEKKRREAAEKSTQTGLPTLTRKIELVQDNKKRAGFLLLLPFYNGDEQPPAPAKRKSAIRGWVYAPFIGQYFMNNLNSRELEYAVYDGEEINDDGVIYKTPEFDSNAALQDITSLNISGGTWTILWHAASDFEAPVNKNLPWISFLIGIFVTSLLASMTFFLNNRGYFAQRLVESRTEELQEVNSELEEFAYRTSHDLRSPIISSTSLLQLAETMIEKDDIDGAKTSIGHAKNSLQRLGTLIDDILELTVIRNKEEEESEISIAAEVSNALEKFSNMDGFQEIDIITHYDFDDAIQIKKLRFSMIAENLISNAIKYQDPEKDQSVIRISTYQENDNFVFEVIDNGIGIPKEHQKDLFQMFKRFHPKVSYGSGLGLYLLKKSTKTLDGEIEYTDLEDGTSFKLKLNALKVRL